ncbi:energy transducer TonB [Hymenobacter sp. IS2118]|uniref:energy transducer TonB n=1 Tax=Hymenobacter sp. IS2118 TaxID=1505605 RepID=UPI0009E068B3|nr:energy transducer TonB [Hymenobacter sp. IS2118]
MTSLLRYGKGLAQASLLLLTATTSVAAQASKSPKQFICYAPIGTMPELPSGGGMQGIVDAIRQKIIYPSQALRKPLNGKVFVNFTVLASGAVAGVKVFKSLRTDYDAAAVQAVTRLPRLNPGRENGKAVPINMTVPISFYVKQ